MSSCDEKEAKKSFQRLPFYVLIEETKIKGLKNIDFLHELPFYGKLSIVKISEAFTKYAGSYKVEIVDSKDPLAASKSSIKDLLKDLLDETEGFKYQVTAK